MHDRIWSVTLHVTCFMHGLIPLSFTWATGKLLDECYAGVIKNKLYLMEWLAGGFTVQHFVINLLFSINWLISQACLIFLEAAFRDCNLSCHIWYVDFGNTMCHINTTHHFLHTSSHLGFYLCDCRECGLHAVYHMSFTVTGYWVKNKLVYFL